SVERHAQDGAVQARDIRAPRGGERPGRRIERGDPVSGRSTNARELAADDESASAQRQREYSAAFDHDGPEVRVDGTVGENVREVEPVVSSDFGEPATNVEPSGAVRNGGVHGTLDGGPGHEGRFLPRGC